MTLIIDAVGASTGGNITILNNILYYLNKIDNSLNIVIFLEKTPSEKFYLYQNNRIIFQPVPDKSLVKKILWQQFELHKTVKSNFPNSIILSITNVVSFFPKIKQIAYFHQGLLFISNKELFKYFSLSYIIRFKILKFFVILGFFRANAIISQTNHIQNSIINEYPKLKNKIHTVYSGNPKVFNENISEWEIPFKIKDEFKIFYIAHPGEYKNFDILFEAAKLAKKNKIKFMFLLTIDKNSDNSRYKNFINTFNEKIINYDIQDYIYFTGILKNSKEIEDAYKFSDVIIHPSFVESFPQTFTEAMQLGKPLLSVDLPYAKEIADDASIYFKATDSNDLLEKIKMLKENKNLLKELSVKSLERSKFFEPENQWLELYNILKKTFQGENT